MTIIDQHIIHLLNSIRECCDTTAVDVGKVLSDSLLRAEIQIGAEKASCSKEKR